MGKKCPPENSEILLLFETSKNDHDVEDEVISALVLNSMCISPKNQKCPFIARIVLLFSRSALLFPRSIFLFNVCLSNDFFPR